MPQKKHIAGFKTAATIITTFQNKRNQQAEERAKKRLEEIEARRKMMDERRSKWEEERWKREEGNQIFTDFSAANLSI